MKISNKGLSVVELIVSFVLCILVFVFIIQVVTSVEELYVNLGIKTELLNRQSLISEQMNNKFTDRKTILIKSCGDDCLTFFYKNNTSEKMHIDRAANNFIFGADVYNFDGLGFVDSLTVTSDDDYAYNQGILTINLNIKNSIFDNGKYIIKALYQYDINETIYSPSTSNKAEIFLLGPATSYKFSEDLFVEPGWIVYYPSGKISINDSDVKPAPIVFDQNGNGSIKYQGVNAAAGVEKIRTIRNYETAKDRIINLYENTSGSGIYLYGEMGRYVYKGSNPDNYITIGSNLFRIISLDIQSQYVLDDDGNVVIIDGEKQKELKYLLKVANADYLKDENGNDLNLKFGNSYGHSVWSTKKCSNDICTIIPQYINSYINDTYLQALLNTGTGKMQIKNGTFNVGRVNFEEYRFSGINLKPNDRVSYQAKKIFDIEGSDVTWADGTTDPGKWNGNCLEDVCAPNAGIISLTDVLFASANSECLDEIVQYGKDGVMCANDNWLWKSDGDNTFYVYRLMTRSARTSTWLSTERNVLSTQDIVSAYQTKATLYLDADLYIMGTGTAESPYKLYSITK